MSSAARIAPRSFSLATSKVIFTSVSVLPKLTEIVLSGLAQTNTSLILSIIDKTRHTWRSLQQRQRPVCFKWVSQSSYPIPPSQDGIVCSLFISFFSMGVRSRATYGYVASKMRFSF